MVTFLFYLVFKPLIVRILLVLVFFFINTYAFSISRPPSSNSATTLSLKASEFVKLNTNDYSRLTGKKMSFFDRISFRILKMRMKHDLRKNPDLVIADYLAPKSTKNNKFKLNGIWLIVGILFGPIGILLAYLTNQEKNKVKSAWLGFGIVILLGLIFLFALFMALANWDGK
jgi:hypothetical protein